MKQTPDARSPANVALVLMAVVFFCGLIVFTLLFREAPAAGMCGFFTGQFTAKANWRLR